MRTGTSFGGQKECETPAGAEGRTSVSPNSRVHCGSKTRASLNRRRVLQGVAALGVPFVIPAVVLGADGSPTANERVHVGVIGVGIRGRYLMGDMPPTARVVAVCDCFGPRVHQVLQPAADMSAGTPRTDLTERDAARRVAYRDYREMFEKTKLDAVVIAVPDHHHVSAAILACQAGLDVYCEKPLSLTVHEGRQLVEAVRRFHRVLQVGSQQRSMEIDRFACEFVRNGGLGKVSYVEVQNWPGPLRYEGLPDEPVPEGMHWDLFLGSTPQRSYSWRLWQKDERQWQGANWRGWDMWRDYSGHLMTNWGAHAVDLVQWALGMDGSGPIEVEPLTCEHASEMRLCPVVVRYANGIELRMTHPRGYSAGGCFYGERGRMIIGRNSFTAFPPELVSAPPGPEATAPWRGKGIVARPHLQNWLDCIKNRHVPNAPVEVGHRTATICHLAGIARELKRKLHWDPQRETFPSDEEARNLLDRPRRTGWQLPEIT